jgi:sensor histidine kinase YesM
MKWSELIFSNRSKYRYKRHAFFWLSWWLFFVSTFFYAQQGLQAVGSLSWIVVVLIKSFTLLLGHAFTVYSIIYFLLPTSLSKHKYLWLITGLLITGIIAIAWAYLCYDLLFPLVDASFHLPSAITKDLILWGSIAAGPISALKVVMAAVSIKLLKRWWFKQKEKEQLEKDKIDTELQLLKAQIQPDFLFTSLDNIYRFAQNDAAKASELLLKLSEMLSYMLYECQQTFVPVEKEVKMIKDYMTLEKIRMEHHLEMDVSIKGESYGRMIAPLILLPFIENVFSVCNREKIEKFWINLDVQMTENSFCMKLINGTSIDSEALVEESSNRLSNIQRRLEIVYPGSYELKITPGVEMIMTSLTIRWKEVTEAKTKMLDSNEKTLSDTRYTYATI